MSDKPMSESRRDAVKLMLGAAVAIPVVSLIGAGAVRAADAPANTVAADDPMAVALKYVADATKSARPAPDQSCATCQFLQAGTGSGDYKACTIFSGKLVNVNGWCSSWAKKPA